MPSRAQNREIDPAHAATAVLLSIALHLGLLTVAAMAGATGLPARPLAEAGLGGAGGPTVEIEIEGPREAASSPVVPQAAPEEQAPATAPPAALERTPAATTDDGIVLPGDAANDGDGEEGERPQLAASPSAGTEGTTTSGGQAPGDPGALILGSAGLFGNGDARRALMPGGADCDDPIAGVWQAMKYRAGERRWVRFTLSIRREGAADLTGTIRSRTWTGSPRDMDPPECTAFGMDITVAMPARGMIRGDAISFGSRSYRIVREDCPARPFQYAPDSFTGSVERDRFDSRNNDGAFDIDEPYLFRRTACAP